MLNQLEAVDPMVLCLRAQVSGFLSDATKFRFEICLSEALSNLALHAASANCGSTIEISLTLAKRSVRVEIYEPVGVPAFDPRDHAVKLSDVDAMAEGGRGLGLITQSADEVNYSRKDDRNCLSLTFHDHPKINSTDHPLKGVN